MAKRRRCDDRCHYAKGTKCACWCLGAFHGVGGTAHRAAVVAGIPGILEEHGFKTGETVYINQAALPITKDTER